MQPGLFPSGPRPAQSIIHAESYDTSHGITIQPPGIGSCDNGDWARYASVDFGTGQTYFNASLAVIPPYNGQKIEVHIDGLTGPIIGTLTTTSTGTWSNFTVESTAITNVTGIHDVYLVFRGRYGICNLNWFDFGTAPGGKPK